MGPLLMGANCFYLTNTPLIKGWISHWVMVNVGRFSFVGLCIRQRLDDRLVCDMQSSKGDWSPHEAKIESKWTISIFLLKGEGLDLKHEMGNGESLGKSYNNRVTLHSTWFDHTVTKQIFLDNLLSLSSKHMKLLAEF